MTASPIGFLKRVFRHLFLDRSYQRYYSGDSWSKDYEDGYDLDRANQDGRYGALVALIMRYGGDGPLLDAGCGDGILAEKIRQVSDAEIHGIDYADSAVKMAVGRSIEGARFEQADFREFTTATKFSAVIFNEALYYVDDSVGTLKAFAAHLADDGVLIVSMFETLVTRRIWRMIGRHFEQLHGVRVEDEESGRAWKIRILKPRIST